MSQEITSQAWRALATRLGVDEPTLKAVAEVESSGGGFLATGEPKVLFEGHAFHKLTKGRFSADHPDLSYPTWTRVHYAKTGLGEWARLMRACELDRHAAHQCASWGAFQVMGFNYGLCGFSSVEAFVNAHRTGTEEQLEAFAQFIARDSFLKPLRARDWARFAALYNGPAFAKNRYDTKLAAAYRRHAGLAGGRRRTRKPKSRPVMPPGRPTFATLPVERRKPALRRPVKADPVDLRDWIYRPTIAKAPLAELWPHNPRPTSQQGETNACTGFSLATVIEYLLARAGRPVEPISGYMLYSMARRYDEWADNDGTDEGSSLRGALKGWSRHGASAARLWTNVNPPKASNQSDDDWFLDSVKRPLGAYYRLSLKALTDIQIALMESGSVYASVLTHAGWHALFTAAPQPAPTSADEIPVIDCRRGQENGGHAIAIVGYTDKGFVVQNSWGPGWGRGGFGILTYSDWRQNVMDAWVVQLGVVTKEHEEVAKASTLRLADRVSGRVVLSSSQNLASHEVSPFVVDIQNEGRLSPRGQFRTFESDLVFLLEHHLEKEACRQWALTKNDVVDVALFAHGGLVGEEAAAESARRWVPLLYSNRIFPVFLMWETDALSTVFSSIEDVLKGDEPRMGAEWWTRHKQRLGDWKDERIEGLTRKPGSALWRQMKDNAEAISSTSASGVVKLFQLFKARQRRLPRVRLHLIGHSAGAIVHTFLGGRALQTGFQIGSLNLIAPAVRVDAFDAHLGSHVARLGIPTLIAHLTDAAEQADSTCSPYGRSLLYLVSRSFEDHTETPILGMEKHLVPAIVGSAWGDLVTRLAAPGDAYRTGGPLTTAATHGGLDDDTTVQDAVIKHIKGPAFTGHVVRPTTSLSSTGADEHGDEGRAMSEVVEHAVRQQGGRGRRGAS